MYLSKKLFDLPLSEIKKYGQENLTYGSLTEKGLHQLKKYIEKYMKDISYNIYETLKKYKIISIIPYIDCNWYNILIFSIKYKWISIKYK
jgi:hypothetical protein